MKKLLAALTVMIITLSPVTSTADDSLAKDMFLKTSLFFSVMKNSMDRCYNNDMDQCKAFQMTFNVVIKSMNSGNIKDKWWYEGLTEYAKSKGYIK